MEKFMEKLKLYDRIAVMGGTFDPIHYGHLVTAEAVRDRFNIDAVVFIPTGRPPHKSHQSVTLDEHRYLMAVQATLSNPFFYVSRMEIDRPGLTYTIDTMQEIKSIAPRANIYFITGADAVKEIYTWNQADKLLEICEFIAVSRPGYLQNELLESIHFLREAKGKIHYMEVPALAISSSDIRHRRQEGKPVKYLLPEMVEDYIFKFDLYRPREISGEIKMDIQAIKEKLQAALTVERYIHTLGVVDESIRLSSQYGEDVEKARFAALLHDCAKNYPKELKLKLAKEYHIKTDDLMLKQTDLIHPFLGAEVAQREYGILDEDILNAIRYHTTGRAHMSKLEQIIYLADILEPNRTNINHIEKIREAAGHSLVKAMIIALESTVEFVKGTGKILHPLTEEALIFFKNLDKKEIQ